MSAQSYVVVDTGTHTILGGPFVVDLDENPDWEPPVEGTLMLSSEAEGQGYTWPEEAPDPATVLREKLTQALGTNGVFLGIGSPSAAQVATQVKALTRQVDALIRVSFGIYDSTSDT